MDTKKYIIEIPENTHWIQWIMEGTKDHHPYMNFKQVEDLVSYTEPDLDAIRNEAYEKGVQDTKQHWVDAPRSCAYKLGYENGLKAAWDAARKIESLSAREFDKAFTGYDDCFKVFENYTPQEAIEKIKAYEQEKEDFKVGDEVISDEDIKGVTVDMDDYLLHVLDENGVIQAWPREDAVKTGRHFPEIAEVLRKMQEEKK